MAVSRPRKGPKNGPVRNLRPPCPGLLPWNRPSICAVIASDPARGMRGASRVPDDGIKKPARIRACGHRGFTIETVETVFAKSIRRGVSKACVRGKSV